MTDTTQVDIAGIALRQYIERIELLEEEKASLTTDIKDVFAEAKGNGFDVKVMRQIIRKRKLDAQMLAEMEEVEHLYRRALGMDT